jgi:serine protease inhibitor ecotin
MSTLQMSCAIHKKYDGKIERKNRSTYKYCYFLFDEIEQQQTST